MKLAEKIEVFCFFFSKKKCFLPSSFERNEPKNNSFHHRLRAVGSLQLVLDGIQIELDGFFGNNEDLRNFPSGFTARNPG
jgi:hypothetical protein